MTRRRPMLAMCLPGLGQVLADEIRGLPGVSDVATLGNDGRADLVEFSIADPRRALSLRCAEDLYATVAKVGRARDLRQLANRLILRDGLDIAEETYGLTTDRPLRKRVSARVISRVTDERNFRRTDLRYATNRELAKARPAWQHGDPAQAEVWVSQTGTRSYVSGLRLTNKEFRQRGGRAVERHGALRPSVASALIRLTSPSCGVLLDPSCGSGTLLEEAHAVGWDVVGSDLDERAITVCAHNVHVASLTVADARKLPFPDACVNAVATNLPFGRQFALQGLPKSWFESVLSELRRVQTPGGPTVVLVPRSRAFTAACSAIGFRVRTSLDINLLGTTTSVWHLQRSEA